MPGGVACGSHQAAAETVIARALAVFVVAMAVQSLTQVPGQTRDLAWWWNAFVGTLLLLSAVWVVVGAIGGRRRRVAPTILAGSAAVGLALWPLAYAGDLDPPWVWNLLGVAVAATAVAWGTRVALVYAAVVSVLFALIRVLPSGGSVGHATAHQDATFLAVAGVALTAAIQAMRVGARRADASTAATEEAYALSARARGRLLERGRMAAILHDSVLAALLSAARAQTGEERRAAARLAADSLHRLRDLSLPTGRCAVPLSELPARLRATAAAASTLPVRVHVQLDPETPLALDSVVEEALVGATYAALDNASRHSGAEHATVRLGYDEPSQRVWVEVRDEGRGFDPTSVADHRLGIRVSIEQRLRDVGGAAHVTSSVGQGTAVVLACPVAAQVAA